MHPWLAVSSVLTGNSRESAKPLKTLAQSDDVQRFAISGREESLVLNLLSSNRLYMALQNLVQVGSDWDAPHAIEPAAVDKRSIVTPLSWCGSEKENPM